MRRTQVPGALVLGLILMLLVPGAAMAADGPTTAEVSDQLNTTWVTVAGVLVMFMQAGFAFLEIGFSRGKNVGAVVAKILTNFSICALVWWAVGFAIAFGGGDKLAGDDGFFFQFGHTISSGLFAD